MSNEKLERAMFISIAAGVVVTVALSIAAFIISVKSGKKIAKIEIVE